jgi:hypothetical protein
MRNIRKGMDGINLDVIVIYLRYFPERTKKQANSDRALIKDFNPGSFRYEGEV